MGSITGNDGIIRLDGLQVIQARSWSVDETGDTAENTVIGSEARTFKKSMVSWSGSIDVYYDTDDIAIDDLFPGMTIELQLYPAGEGIGDAYLLGNAVVTSLTNGASFDGMIERSISFQGTGILQHLSFLGFFEGNDICDKPGDLPGECIEPDYRNPTERFEERTFQDGDSYIISDVENFVPAHVNIVDEIDMVIRPVQVYNGETIINRTLSAPGPEGWYIIQRDILAENVLFNDAVTIIKGENVQLWNEAADLAIAGKVNKSGDTMTGPLLCNDYIGLSNDIALMGRNFANSANIQLAQLSTSNAVELGSLTTLSGTTHIRAGGIVGVTVRTTEVEILLSLICNDSVRIPNDIALLARNSADSANIQLIQISSTNAVQVGSLTTLSGTTIIRAGGVSGMTFSTTTITAHLQFIEEVLLNASSYGQVDIDFTEKSQHEITCTAPTTLTFINPLLPGQIGGLKLKINTGGNAVTLPANLYFKDGIRPVINSGIWILYIHFDGTDLFINPEQFSIA